MASEGRFAVTRRSVLDYFLGGGFLALLGTMAYPVFRYLLPQRFTAATVDSVRAARKSEIKPNSAKLFRFGSAIGILVQTPAGEYRAFSATCTHLSCTVQYREDLEHIWCACHNGHFDLFGRNIGGPPPTPLTPYDVTVRGEEIFVSARKV
jgi:nitrite reductase/ring-hydroxylating ferredoxin subunit